MTRRREVVDNRLCTMMLQPFRLGVVEATKTKHQEQGTDRDNEPTTFRFHDGIPTAKRAARWPYLRLTQSTIYARPASSSEERQTEALPGPLQHLARFGDALQLFAFQEIGRLQLPRAK